MLFFTGIVIVMIFIAFRYFYAGINGTKSRNQELLQQVNDLNEQLDLLAEKEAKAKREGEIAYNAKVKLLSLLSHEIRTPMNGVIGMTTLLAGTDLNTEQREYTNIILECGTKLLSNVDEILINDMLDFSKIDSETVELGNKNFDLGNCIEEVMGIFAGKAAEAGLELLYHIESDVPLQIKGDYKRLQQVLINLLENAINATEKGEVLLSVNLVSAASADQLQIGFNVMDTGKGIPHEQLHQIFKGVLPADYSTKTKEVSTGFGLVICKRLVEQMGGEITVESQTGVGTKFMFNILTSASDLPVTDYIHNRIIGLEEKQILVVDDNETSISILSKQLDQWKLLPVLAGSGKQALEILSQISVDLVITDLLMPGMNGLQLSEQIRSGYPKIPIILMNTVNDDQYKQQADIFSSIISKPVKLHSLFDSILTGIRNGDNFTESSALTQIPDNFSDKSPLQILVAEDNPVNQKWIKKILLKIGYQCEMAENGKVVMEKVSTENFDLIFMDVQMPEMDGLEATRMIRLCLENQPIIIAMTANAMQGDRDECIQSGMNDYVSKPVKLPVLLNMLEKWALLIKDKRQHAIREKNVL